MYWDDQPQAMMHIRRKFNSYRPAMTSCAFWKIEMSHLVLLD